MNELHDVERESIDETAARYVVRLDGAQRSDGVWEECTDWMRSDPKHLKAFSQALLTRWVTESLLAGKAEGSPASPVATVVPAEVHSSEPNRRNTPVSGVVLGLIGLGILLAAGFILFWLSTPKTYMTDVGKQTTVELPDGSSIKLNTDTVVQVAFSSSQRNISLVKGEALFNAMHDEKRPFRVTSEGMAVLATGTEFIVRREPNGRLQVVVKAGAVEVGSSDASRAGERLPVSANETVLSAGDIGIASQGHVTVERSQQEEVQRRLAWINGKLWFRGETLEQIAAEFNRYNRRHLIIADPWLAKQSLSGVFPATEPEKFVKMLEKTLGVRVVPAEPGGKDEIWLVAGRRHTED